MSDEKIHVGVVGAGQCSAEVARRAELVGRAIARSGAVLVCGGLGGVMEAAARGAREEGGFTLGILPGSTRQDANAHIDCAIATGLGDFRNFLIAQTADVLVAVGGRYGTLSEIAMALTLGKKVFAVGSWEIDGVESVESPEEAVCRAIEAVR